jgi:hypothetical protein
MKKGIVMVPYFIDTIEIIVGKLDKNMKHGRLIIIMNYC